MAKKRGSGQSKAPNRSSMASHRPVSLRAEASGLKPTAKGGGNTNPKSMLKLEHLQKLAVWGGGEGSVPSLGAFFGRRLAAVSESLAVPPDPSLLSCQRCETILQPGFNCTTRIEKNITKPRRRRGKKPNTAHKNNMVYTCSFCSHKNLKRGTPKSHLKDINPKPKPKSKKPKPEKKSLLQMHTDPETGTETELAAEKMEVNDSAAMEEEEVMPLESPATPLVRTLLDMKKRKRNKSASKRPTEPESPSINGNSEASAGASSKRRRKSWMSLKEITEGNEQSRNIGDLKIPFFG